MTPRARTILVTTAALVLTGTMAGRAKEPAPAAGEAARIKRGEYLVNIMSCNDCHTPFKMGPKGPEPDMSRMLSGHPQDMPLPAPPANVGPWISHTAATNTAWAGPWGVSFTANLTPDKETGLGDWTEEMFLAMIRTGRHQGKGRAILPPMVVPALQAATIQDQKDIFLYLRSITPIRNKVPQPIDPAD